MASDFATFKMSFKVDCIQLTPSLADRPAFYHERLFPQSFPKRLRRLTPRCCRIRWALALVNRYVRISNVLAGLSVYAETPAGSLVRWSRVIAILHALGVSIVETSIYFEH